MLDPARWELVQDLFHRALELPEPEREGFLVRAAGGDAGLVAEVRSLLLEDASAQPMLDGGVAKAAKDLLDDPAGELPRESFGPYRITGVLGEGGMGVVYLAQRADLGSIAAIKILRDAWLSPARRERFASEQRTLAQLHHPAIAQLYDADTLPDGTPWFVMEYVEGLPLTAYCRSRNTSIRGRIQLLRAVAVAVQHAHGQAVIHRDLKPSNILVKPDGTVKLLDFGIAKQVESLEVPVEQTQTGVRLMTPAYAAPEQIRAGRIGTHTDVYSLGVVLYELLTERLPYDLADRSPLEIEEAITAQTPARPSSLARAKDAEPVLAARARGQSAAAWAELDVLCFTAMHKDPDRRYRSMDALIRDLDHFLAGEPLEARPDSVRYRVRKFVGRNQAAVIMSTLAALALVGLVVFYTVRLTRARNTAVAEAARAQRIQGFMLRLFEGGDHQVGPSDSLRVRTLVDRGLREARSLSGEPVAQAELFATLGGIYQKLGDLGQADSLLQQALDRRRALFPEGSAEVTTSRVELGLLRLDQARYEDGQALIQEGLRQGGEVLRPAHPAMAQAAAALGSILQARGRYDSAIVAGEEAVRRYDQAGDSASSELAGALAELAGSHFYAGHYETSDSINRRVMAMYRTMYGESHPLVASVLFHLGASQFERGRYAEAEALDRQGLAIYRGFYGEQHHETAYGLTMLARAVLFQSRFDEASGYLRTSLAIRERVFGAVHPEVASTLNELGNIAYQRDRLDEAEGYWTRMAEIYKEVYHDRHYLIGIALSNIASVYVKRTQYARAEALYREVMRRYEGELPPDHVNVGITRIKLGRALLRQRKFREAATESQAGYDILMRQSSPGVSFLKAARTDLALAYDSLGQPAKAARFKAELADTLKAKSP